MPKGDPCQKQACDLQVCLQGAKYQEEKCAKFIEALRNCCKKFADRSDVCGGVTLDQSTSKTN